MIALLQRVSRAQVVVAGEAVASIELGILAMVCAERGDGRITADRLLERLLGYRVFPDAAGKMNLSVQDIGGGLLLVPQFTLAADTSGGMRPSFSSALAAGPARELFDYLVVRARLRHRLVSAGRFGAHMQVSLTNDGPVTFWLRAMSAEDRSGTATR